MLYFPPLSLPPSLFSFLSSPPHNLQVHLKLSAVMIVSHVHLELLLFMRNTGRERGRKGKREEEEEGRREGGGGREGGREGEKV